MISAVIFGVLAIGMSYLAPLLGPVVVQIPPTVTGVVGPPLFSIFFLGFYVPWSNKWVGKIYCHSQFKYPSFICTNVFYSR